MAKISRVLAFDMGGTKTASAVVEVSGLSYKILDYKKEETPKSEKEIVAKFLKEISDYSRKYNFKKVGISIAGQINEAGDVLVHAPNLALSENLRLAKILEKKTGLEVMLKNDVKSFAAGEDVFGKYGGYKNAIFIAIGTGVGGAIKVNGKFYQGSHNIAGEFGHMAIAYDGEECACGRRGCFEKYVSGAGLEKIYDKNFAKTKNAKDILDDATRGSMDDVQAVIEASYFLALGIANLVNILDPEIVVIGGSMVKKKDLLKMAIPLIREQVLPPARKVKIVNSSLGDDAYLLGGAIM